jgi:predicted site-specific integrase-resolvase
MIHLYARVSTDKQENGREAQTKRLLDWAQGKEAKLWVDEDVSAYNVRMRRHGGHHQDRRCLP